MPEEFETSAEPRESVEPKKKKKKEKPERKMPSIRLFPADRKGRHHIPILNFFHVLMGPWNAVLYPYKLHGHTKVGPGAYIYIGNHQCMWDVFYPVRTTWEGIHFIAKHSLTKSRFVAYCAYRMGVITAKRDGSDVRTLMDAIKCLRNGEKISLFPEGTRNRGDGEELLPFHGGAAMLAIKTKTPIIPFISCNKPRLFRRTHVVFGEPMELSEYYDRKLTQEDYEEAEGKLRARMYELRANFRAEQELKKQKKRKKAKKEAKKEEDGQ